MKIGICLASKNYNVEYDLIKLYGEEFSNKILDKTGPKVLKRCLPNEDSVSLGIEAIKNLKTKFDVNFHEVSNLISVSETPRLSFPGNAAFFASNFPFENNISIFDLNSGCTGFVDALKISFGLNGKTLIICSETYSKHIPSFNRATSTLFSDGASAVFLNAHEWELIDSYSIIKPNSFLSISRHHNLGELVMEGNEVYNFVIQEVSRTLIEILKNTPAVRRVYVHQGSKLVVDHLISKLKKFNVRVPENISKYGNLVSATLPILIANDIEINPIDDGEIICIAGFGVGLAFSACLIKRKNA